MIQPAFPRSRRSGLNNLMKKTCRAVWLTRSVRYELGVVAAVAAGPSAALTLPMLVTRQDARGYGCLDRRRFSVFQKNLALPNPVRLENFCAGASRQPGQRKPRELMEELFGCAIGGYGLGGHFISDKRPPFAVFRLQDALAGNESQQLAHRRCGGTPGVKQEPCVLDLPRRNKSALALNNHHQGNRHTAVCLQHS